MIPHEAYREAIDWIPKGIMLFVVVALGYFCWLIIRYVVKTKHGEIMEKFSHLDKHLIQLRDNIMHLNDKIGAMVTNEQHKEAKREIKESLFELKDQVHEKIDELRARVQYLEKQYDSIKHSP